jgi:crotonobetaine/carnitine-CoA ligase
MTAYEGEWVASAILEDRAAKLGDRTFITSPHGDLTYAELAEAAARVAGALAERGIRPGDRVATMLPSGIEYLKVWWGIVWAGAVDVPVNNDFKGEFLDHVVGGSQAKLLVIDPRWRDRAQRYEAIAVGPGELDADPVERVPRRERDLLYIMYTSGTTGRAKGVMHANRSALWNAAAWLEILGPRTPTRRTRCSRSSTSPPAARW